MRDGTKRYLLEYGKPVAFYSDKHAVFRVNKAGGSSGPEGSCQCTCCTSVPYAL
jgi:hypothetical protein